MSFESYIQENYPALLREGEEVTVDLDWLRGFWLASQSHGETGDGGLIKPGNMKYVSKRWGWELWIANNEQYCGKLLFVKQGKYLSYHHHDIKDEVLYVHSGGLYFTWGSDEAHNSWTKVMPGYAFHVKPGVVHQMQAIEDTLIIEFSTQHFDEDSFRTTTDLVVNHEVDDDEWQR